MVKEHIYNIKQIYGTKFICVKYLCKCMCLFERRCALEIDVI